LVQRATISQLIAPKAQTFAARLHLGSIWARDRPLLQKKKKKEKETPKGLPLAANCAADCLAAEQSIGGLRRAQWCQSQFAVEWPVFGSASLSASLVLVLVPECRLQVSRVRSEKDDKRRALGRCFWILHCKLWIVDCVWVHFVRAHERQSSAKWRLCAEK